MTTTIELVDRVRRLGLSRQVRIALWLGVVSAVVMLAAAASTCHAATRPRGPSRSTMIGTAETPASVRAFRTLVSDRDRYVAWVPQGTTDTLVYDTKLGSSFRTAGCQIESGAPGVFLVGCGTGSSAAQLLDIKTGIVRNIPGARTNDEFFDIGRFWARGYGESCQDVHCPLENITVNWHTGKRRVCYDDGSEYCPDYDLDTKAGKRLRGLPAGHQPGYLWYWDGVTVKLSLWREKPLRLVARLARGCGEFTSLCQPELYAGRMSWTEPAATERVGVYSIRKRRALRWRIAPECVSGQEGPLVGQVHTRFGLVIRAQQATGDDCSKTPFDQVWLARWPRWVPGF
jgi:hypothetical protein